MKNLIILENIRSAYNVGNIIRTADALWRDVRLSGYTPHPEEQKKVIKTSLWAEKNVNLKRFDNTLLAIEEAKNLEYFLVAGEITKNAKALNEINHEKTFALILWNEVDWVLQSTLDKVNEVIFIPMKWIKESLNVGQSAAIFMREMSK